MRGGNRLTALKVASLKKPGRYCDGHGLWLQVRGPTSKAWVFRYMLDGQARHMGLGPLHTVGLAEARERALRARQCLLDGVDPLEAKRGAIRERRLAAARLVTFRQCADDYISAHSPSWRSDKHRYHWRATLESYTYPIIGDLPVQDIDTELVLAVLRPIWTAKPETASRIRSRIEAVLAYWAATQRLPRDNPARWRGHLDRLLPAKTKLRSVKHHRALPYEDLPAFMARLRESGAASAAALQFAILTATRTSEVVDATWGEIDGRIWTIPAERMKADKPHRVPLTDDALGLITTKSGLLFPGARPGKPMSNWTMLRLVQSMDRTLTVHGFRSTFSDWARDKTSFPRDVVELALAHTIRDRTEAAYRRGDALEKRRALMSEWAHYCESPAINAVVTLHE